MCELGSFTGLYSRSAPDWWQTQLNNKHSDTHTHTHTDSDMNTRRERCLHDPVTPAAEALTPQTQIMIRMNELRFRQTQTHRSSFNLHSISLWISSVQQRNTNTVLLCDVWYIKTTLWAETRREPELTWASLQLLLIGSDALKTRSQSSELNLTNQQRRDLPEPTLTDTFTETTTRLTRIHLKSREYTSHHENTPQITRLHLTSRDYTSNHENTPHITRIHLTLWEYTSNHEITPHITRIHLKSREYTSNHENTPQITRIHLKSREYTSHHENTPQITRIHLTSREYTSNHENTPHITRIHLTSREYT